MTRRFPNGRGRRALLALSVFCMFAGCTGGPTQLPAITDSPTGAQLPGKFVWCDLVSEDPMIAAAFYRALFGWSFESRSPSYIEIRHRTQPVGGVLRQIDDEPTAPESLWVCSLSVLDVQAAAQLTRARGGNVLEGPFESPRGEFAVVRDPVGATLVVLRSKQGDLPDSEPGVGDWLWMDLFTHDVEKAQTYYGELVGYESEVLDLDGDVHTLFKIDTRARAGVVALPWQHVDDNWLPYVRVTDTKQTIKRAVSLGGQVVLEADKTAILVDPMGAAFGVQELQPR